MKSRVAHTQGLEGREQAHKTPTGEQPAPGTGIGLLSCFRVTAQAAHRGPRTVSPTTLDLGLLGEEGDGDGPLLLCLWNVPPL